MKKGAKGEKTGTSPQSVPGLLLIEDDKRRSMLRFIYDREIGTVQRVQRPLLQDILRIPVINNPAAFHQYHAVGITRCEVEIVQDAADAKLPFTHQATQQTKKVLLVVNIQAEVGSSRNNHLGRGTGSQS